MSARSRRAAIELEVAAAPGVLALYPVALLPGAPRVLLEGSGDHERCRVRLAVDAAVPAREVIDAVTAAARRASGDPALAVDIELASVD